MSLRLSLATCLAVACTVLAAAPATAASVTLPQTITPGFNGATWYLRDYGPGSGLNIEEAVLARAGDGGHGDGYDGAWRIGINGTYVTGGTVDLTGTTLTAGPVAVSGLDVTVQHYFSPTSSLARILVTLRNPSPGAVTTTVDVATNLGSDGNTLINATSSGNQDVTSDDRWVVSSDFGPFDPVITTVLYGPGTPAVTPSSFVAVGDNLTASFPLTVPAGATRSLMFFAGLGGVTAANNTVASAQAAATLFDSNATLRADWLSGLTATQQSQVANWSLNAFTSCAAERYTGAKLTLCRHVCEIDQSPSRLTGLIRLYMAIYRSEPPCAR